MTATPPELRRGRVVSGARVVFLLWRPLALFGLFVARFGAAGPRSGSAHRCAGG